MLVQYSNSEPTFEFHLDRPLYLSNDVEPKNAAGSTWLMTSQSVYMVRTVET